jgi:hypothetical protein
MKKKLSLIITGLAVAGALSCVLPSVLAQQTTNAPAPGAHHERHPEIRRAIGALEAAKTHLQKANHDFGGHRAAALEECDKALEQLKLAMQFDKE